MAWESADPLVRYRTFEELGTDLPHPMSDHVPMDMFACECDCGGVKVRLVLPESEDLVVDVYSALGKPNDDPHWADLWHGSVALAAAIFANPDVVRGKRVVDLGCGLGLGGIAAAMCGAKEVVMTDREERALWCSLAGCALNGVADVTPLTGDTNEPDGVALPPLPTQLPCSDIRSHPSKCVVSAAKVDWFEPETAPTGSTSSSRATCCTPRSRWTPSRRWCFDCSTGTVRTVRGGSCSRIRPGVSRRITRGSWR